MGMGKIRRQRTEHSAVMSTPPARKFFVIVGLVLLAFSTLLSSFACSNGEEGASGFSDDKVERLDKAIAEEVQENNLPGVAVGVWVPGEGEYVVARGKANLKTGEQRDLDDPFRIASITKTFTATAILQLVEEGKLSMSAKLSKWYPDFPNAHKITIEHLLRMQSGIYDPDYEDIIRRYTSPEEVIEASAERGYVFGTPGQRNQYTNVNYVILGEIISKVSDKDTDDQITEGILKPLGMKNTLYPTNNNLPGDLHGYSLNLSTGGLKDTTNINPTATGGAASMISDISDLKTWAKAVCTGRLLKPKTQKARLETEPIEGRGNSVEFGEGIWKVGRFCGHDGAIDGFSTQMWYLPEEDATVVVNVNRLESYSEPPAEAILGDIIEILFPKYVPRVLRQ
jgi:D-alanyl-D-alanine carboxypeptidase